MAKPNDQPALDTKQRLIEAAIEELAQRGWGGLRTRSVAERAGVNKALIHYHFGSMENLRFEAVATAMSETVNEAAMAIVAAPTLEEGLHQFGVFLDTFEPDDARSVVLMDSMMRARHEPRLGDMLSRVLDLYQQGLSERIRTDVAAGALPADTDADGLALALTAALDGLALHAYVRTDIDFTAAGSALAALLRPSATTTRR